MTAFFSQTKSETGGGVENAWWGGQTDWEETNTVFVRRSVEQKYLLISVKEMEKKTPNSGALFWFHPIQTQRWNKNTNKHKANRTWNAHSFNMCKQTYRFCDSVNARLILYTHSLSVSSPWWVPTPNAAVKQPAGIILDCFWCVLFHVSLYPLEVCLFSSSLLRDELCCSVVSACTHQVLCNTAELAKKCVWACVKTLCLNKTSNQ